MRLFVLVFIHAIHFSPCWLWAVESIRDLKIQTSSKYRSSHSMPSPLPLPHMVPFLSLCLHPFVGLRLLATHFCILGALCTSDNLTFHVWCGEIASFFTSPIFLHFLAKDHRMNNVKRADPQRYSVTETVLHNKNNFSEKMRAKINIWKE